ncbi:hypothetical protein AWV80_14980 [Cupriavidus sp. UYMU48A]|nr:hypothetical protein AWV80_14980 [Cupriavidus sp. UYMU48A]
MSGQLSGLAWVAGETLMAFLWKGLCIQAAAACLLWVFRPPDARTRYAILCAALFLCAAVPAMDAAAYLDAWQTAGVLADGAAGALPSLMTELMRAPDPDVPWQVWLAVTWLTGVVLMTLRLLLGLAWLRRTFVPASRGRTRRGKRAWPRCHSGCNCRAALRCAWLMACPAR